MASCSEGALPLSSKPVTVSGIAHSAPSLDAADWAAVRSRLESGWIARGEATVRFAQALSAQAGATSTALTASGTGGLALALHALGVGVGDEVIVPTYVCASVLEAVRSVGAMAVLCDIGTDWLMTADTVARRQTIRTRAIIVASVYGLAWDVEALGQLGVPIIDDRCQAFGLPRPTHSVVQFSVCSFHATKCLTTGEGGAVLAWTTDAAARLESAAQAHRRTLCVFSDLQAALGIAQLTAWPERQRRRTQIAAYYLRALPTAQIERLRAASARGSVWFRVPVTLASGITFDVARARFAEYGVQVRRGVDTLLHRAHGLPDDNFPGSVAAFDSTLSLPIWPSMSDAEVARVVEVSSYAMA